MAIRFIDTNFYKSPFVRGLEGSLKSLYGFIICDCTGAGIWSFDLDVAAIYTGFKYTKKQFESAFVDPGKAIDLGDGKYFFPDFLEHQYPKGLSAKNPAQKNFISELQKYNLLDNELRVIKGSPKGLQSPISNSLGNSNGLGEGLGNSNPAEEIEVAELYNFDLFWDLYDKKVDRKACEKKWDRLKPAEKQAVILHVPKYNLSTPDKTFRKNPETYLNNRSWENEIIEAKPPEAKIVSVFERQKQAGEKADQAIITKVENAISQNQ